MAIHMGNPIMLGGRAAEKEQLFHKVPWREVGVPLLYYPPRMAGLANSSNLNARS